MSDISEAQQRHDAAVETIHGQLIQRGWPVRSHSFTGIGDILASIPPADLLLVEVKVTRPSERVRFNQLAQLADWIELTESIDQIRRAHAVLVTDGKLEPSTEAYARDARVEVIPLSSDLVGQRVVETVERHL